MDNPYAPPSAQLERVSSAENNSGGGEGIAIPEGVRGWSWGAFLLNGIWAVFNRTWIGLICFVPYIGFLFAIGLGIWGREMAWKNKRWDSVEEFDRVQRNWSMWGLIAYGAMMLGTAIPFYQQYLHRTGV
jgi:hypothetical protein